MAAMTLDGFTQALRDAHGDALRAVVLYGSAARGEHVAKHSDHNVLVLVRALTPAALRASARATREWTALGNPPPLILTESEWHTSRDVFAIEVADILAHHRELWGTLPHGVAVEAANLRHQLEFEAMGKLLALRQGLLAADGDAELEIALLTATRSAVLVLFRTLLRVHGEPAADSAAEVVRRAARHAGFDPAPFLKVLSHVDGSARIVPAEADALLAAYHAGLERFVAHVDAIVHSGSR